ncbi:hypothetical protein ACFV9E_24570, partial [Streptomyces sp. NPDC059835]
VTVCDPDGGLFTLDESPAAAGSRSTG